MKTFYVIFMKIALIGLVWLSGCCQASAQIVLPDSLFESISRFDPAHARTGDNVLRVNGRSSGKIGYQKLIPVKVGQEVTTEAYAYYEKGRKKKWLKTLFEAAGGIVATQTQQLPSQTFQEGRDQRGKPFPFVGLGVAVAPGALKGIFKNVPKASVQYNFYDKDSSFVESVTQGITKEARDQWQLLHLDRKAKQDGFVEVIVVNKSQKDVWFDDLIITVSFGAEPITPGPITNSYPDDPSTTNQYRVYVRSFAPPTSFASYGFEDDNRGFSLSEAVTSRVRQEYVIIPDGINGVIAGGVPRSDPTIKISTGESRTGVPRGEARITSMSRSGGNNIARVYTIYEGSNPFYDPFAPDIEVETRMTVSESVNKNRLTLTLTANSKRFPALEIFVEDIYGTKVFIAVEGAYGGPGDLILRSKTHSTITADVSININTSGVFQSVYRTGSISQTYSIQLWNQQYTSQNAGPF